jgi:hypothetical protein
MAEEGQLTQLLSQKPNQDGGRQIAVAIFQNVILKSLQYFAVNFVFFSNAKLQRI